MALRSKSSQLITPPSWANPSFLAVVAISVFPYPLLKQWTKNSEYVMSYLHPRDFDAGQPLLNDLPLSRKFKSYVGLKGATAKLDKWLSDFEFVDIQTAVSQIDWNKVPVVEI
jgi:hypothetical protein